MVEDIREESCALLDKLLLQYIPVELSASAIGGNCVWGEASTLVRQIVLLRETPGSLPCSSVHLIRKVLLKSTLISNTTMQ